MAMKDHHKPSKKDLTQFPIEHLDLEKVRTVKELVEGMKHISFQSRTLGLVALLGPEDVHDEPGVSGVGDLHLPSTALR